MIEIQDLSKYFSGASTAAVRGLDLTVAEGELLALIGPSGCGKTTTLNMLNRLVEPSGGTIHIAGRDIRTGDPVLLRRHIGYVFQNTGLFPHMTVAENIAITPRLLGWSGRDIAARVTELLALVQLSPSLSERLPAQLSGGQRQRVALGRALAARPGIMLLDEPFGALDPLIRDEICEDYRKIHTSQGLTTVMVTHDMTEALLMADRIAVMRAGELVQVGPPPALLDQPADDFVTSMIEAPRRQAARLAAAFGAA